MDLYNVEVITEMEDNTGKEEMASPREEENEDNDDPVSVELGELKARALRYKNSSKLSTKKSS